MLTLLAGLVAISAVATAADFVWYTFGIRHTLTAGVVHGVLVLAVVGTAMGALVGSPLKGLPIGGLAGLGGALSYYGLAAVLDARPYGTAIPLSWMILWMLLAALDGRWVRSPRRRSWRQVFGRGGASAVLAGAAFGLMMPVLWGRAPAGGRNYAIQFVAWLVAWTPGVLILAWPLARSGAIHGRSATE